MGRSEKRAYKPGVLGTVFRVMKVLLEQEEKTKEDGKVKRIIS